MTGDWGGTRSRWKEEGVDLEFKFVSFYQQIASGGTNDNGSYTANLKQPGNLILERSQVGNFGHLKSKQNGVLVDQY